jgi:hypothetical protein
VIYVRADPSDVPSSKFCITEQEFDIYVNTISRKARLAVLPNMDFAQHVALKRYALDLQSNMHEGTIVFDMRCPNDWDCLVLTMDLSSRWRLKPGLCNSGKGHGRCQSLEHLKRFLKKTQRRTPNGGRH